MAASDRARGSQVDRGSRIDASTVGLGLLATSLFYCLPLGRYSLVGISSDFRIYDIAIVLFCLLFGARIAPRARKLLIRKSGYLIWAGALLVLVWLSLTLTLVLGGSSKVLPAVLRALRFTAYMLVPSAVLVVANSPRRVKFLADVFYANIAVQAGIAILQSRGLIPSLWPQYWAEAYGGGFPVATLSPHHKHIAVVMLLGIGLSMTYIMAVRSILARGAALVILCSALVVGVLSGARTFFLGLLAMILAYVFAYRIRGARNLLVATIAIGAVSVLLFEESQNPVREVMEERVFRPVETQGYEGLYGDRTVIYFESFPKAISRNPWILAIGTGFQNIGTFLGATGGHNNYLHVLMELGVVGLVVYLALLWRILGAIQRSARYARNRFEFFLAKDAWVAFVGVLATMLVGESLWAQYSMFTLTGQIMFYIGLATAQSYQRIGGPNWERGRIQVRFSGDRT